MFTSRRADSQSRTLGGNLVADKQIRDLWEREKTRSHRSLFASRRKKGPGCSPRLRTGPPLRPATNRPGAVGPDPGRDRVSRKQPFIRHVQCHRQRQWGEVMNGAVVASLVGTGVGLGIAAVGWWWMFGKARREHLAYLGTLLSRVDVLAHRIADAATDDRTDVQKLRDCCFELRAAICDTRASLQQPLNAVVERIALALIDMPSMASVTTTYIGATAISDVPDNWQIGALCGKAQARGRALAELIQETQQVRRQVARRRYL